MENTHILNKLLEKIEDLEKEVKLLRQEVKGNTISYPSYTPSYVPNHQSDFPIGIDPNEIVLGNHNHSGTANYPNHSSGTVTVENLDNATLTVADGVNFIGYNQVVDNS